MVSSELLKLTELLLSAICLAITYVNHFDASSLVICDCKRNNTGALFSNVGVNTNSFQAKILF